jgi:hypothetical protein
MRKNKTTFKAFGAILCICSIIGFFFFYRNAKLKLHIKLDRDCIELIQNMGQISKSELGTFAGLLEINDLFPRACPIPNIKAYWNKDLLPGNIRDALTSNELPFTSQDSFQVILVSTHDFPNTKRIYIVGPSGPPKVKILSI